MSRTVEFDPNAVTEFRELDPDTRKRIVEFLRTKIGGRSDPRTLGKALLDAAAGFWRYDVGKSHRMVLSIEDARRLVTVMRVGHRDNLYR